MLFILTTLAFGLMAMPLLKETVTAPGRVQAHGFNGVGVLICFVFTAMVAALTSPRLGMAFVFTVLFYEFLSVRACSILGHRLVHLRLVPLPGLAPNRSPQNVGTELEASFLALFAPALAILPLLFALGVFYISAGFAPGLAAASRDMAVMIGAFNFILLLPFRPFPGGHVVSAVTQSIWPKFNTLVTLFMAAAFLSAAHREQSIALAILGCAGLQSLLHKKRPAKERLSPNQSLLVLSTYSFTLTVHFLGGFWLIKNLI